MFDRIETLKETFCAGMSQEMSFAKDQTFKLFSTFMPRRDEIEDPLSDFIISLQEYPDFFGMDEHTRYTKWALKEVAPTSKIPNGMQSYVIPSGLYAVFVHKGTAADFPDTMEYIIDEWLYNSDYDLDETRPHFELLGAKYKPNSPDSEEEVWIPIF